MSCSEPNRLVILLAGVSAYLVALPLLHQMLRAWFARLDHATRIFRSRSSRSRMSFAENRKVRTIAFVIVLRFASAEFGQTAASMFITAYVAHFGDWVFIGHRQVKYADVRIGNGRRRNTAAAIPQVECFGSGGGCRSSSCEGSDGSGLLLLVLLHKLLMQLLTGVYEGGGGGFVIHVAIIIELSWGVVGGRRGQRRWRCWWRCGGGWIVQVVCGQLQFVLGKIWVDYWSSAAAGCIWGVRRAGCWVRWRRNFAWLWPWIGSGGVAPTGRPVLMVVIIVCMILGRIGAGMWSFRCVVCVGVVERFRRIVTRVGSIGALISVYLLLKRKQLMLRWILYV